MIDPQRLAGLRRAGEHRFAELHSRSAELSRRARGSLLAGRGTRRPARL